MALESEGVGKGKDKIKRKKVTHYAKTILIAFRLDSGNLPK